jgi:hypothetical protein
LCRAVCAELAGATVPLREILRARNQRRRELRGVLRDRQAAVDTLLHVKRGESTEKESTRPATSAPISGGHATRSAIWPDDHCCWKGKNA